MGGAARSAGFGRIGGRVEPSPYTPVHLATSRPSEDRRDAPPGRHGPARVDVAVGVAIAVAALLAIALGSVLSKPRPLDAAPVDTASEEAPVLDAEAERLNRSAIATHRGRG